MTMDLQIKSKTQLRKQLIRQAEAEKREINNDGSLTQPEKRREIKQNQKKLRTRLKTKVEAAKDADAVEKAKTAGEKSS